jgi:oxaloacetate decarboxylase
LTAALRRERFSAILAGDRCISPADIFDPISARIAQEIGFETLLLAGSMASATILGAADDVVITLTELAEQVRRISRACDVPLIVDADHGYGNALNVRRTVEELEAAGAAALLLEDTLLPVPFGASKTQLITIEEGVGKIRAAIDAREDSSCAIVARTAAIGLTGLEDAVARGKAYAAAGADALFFGRLRKRDELERIASTLSVPIVIGHLPVELADREYLASRGVRIALEGNHDSFRAAIQAISTTLRALRSGTPVSELTGVAPPDVVEQIVREDVSKRHKREFLAFKPT